MRKLSPSLVRFPIRFFAWMWTAVSLLPLIWMYYSSMKSLPELTVNKWMPTLSPRWNNYVEAWTGIVTEGRAPSVPIPVSRYFLNSTVVTVGALALTLTIATLAAYALARHRVPVKPLLLGLLVLGLTMPSHALVLPIWVMEDQWGLLNTYPGLILPYTGITLPFALVLLIAYFRTFPREIEEAAEIDGCTTLGTFWRVVLPMSTGPITAIGILLANGFWNEFLYSLVLMPDNYMKTLPVGLFNFNGEYFTPYNLQLAVLAIATTPIVVLFLFFQRQITDSMGLDAALKG